MASTTLTQQITSFAQKVGTDVKGIIGNIGTLSNLTTMQKASLVVALNEVAGKAATLETSVGTNTASIGTINTQISELDSAVKALEGIVASQTNIDDANVATTTTYSSSKIESVVTDAKAAVKNDLLGGAGDAYDTLKELADLIATNKETIDALQELAAGHVRYNAAQELTAEQKAQARTNIGAGSAEDVATAKTQADKGVEDAGKAQTTANEAKTAAATAQTQADKGVADAAKAQTAADNAKAQADLAVENAATADAKAVAAQSKADSAYTKAEAAQADVDALEAAIGDVTTDYVAIYNTAVGA